MSQVGLKSGLAKGGTAFEKSWLIHLWLIDNFQVIQVAAAASIDVKSVRSVVDDDILIHQCTLCR